MERLVDINMVQSFNWELLQRSLLMLNHTPMLILGSQNINTVRWLLEAVVNGFILAPALADQKLEVHLGNWVDGVNIPTTFAEYTVDGSSLLLDPMQRFEYSLHNKSYQFYPGDWFQEQVAGLDSPEEYLRGILAQQTAAAKAESDAITQALPFTELTPAEIQAECSSS